MELITIDDKYTTETLFVFNKNGITYPKEGDIVELLSVEKYPRLGKIGLVIHPHQNQYIRGSVAGISGDNQVSFSHKRFSTLLGGQLDEEELRNWNKNKEKEHLLVEISPKKKENEKMEL